MFSAVSHVAAVCVVEITSALTALMALYKQIAWHCCIQDLNQPIKWLSEMFDKYIPDTIFEMVKSYRHITPLSTMNFVSTLTNILEGVLKPENLSNKAEQGLFEMYFVFAAIWAFGGGLVEKDGVDYRRNFDKWWKQTWTTVKLPGGQLAAQC